MCLLVGQDFALPLEESGSSFDGAGLPGTEQVRKDLELGSDLVERSLFLEGFENGFGFEFGRMSFSHGDLSLTYFRRFSCPDSPDHYTSPPLRLGEGAGG